MTGSVLAFRRQDKDEVSRLKILWEGLAEHFRDRGNAVFKSPFRIESGNLEEIYKLGVCGSIFEEVALFLERKPGVSIKTIGDVKYELGWDGSQVRDFARGGVITPEQAIRRIELISEQTFSAG
jgi:hypothetical protein